MTEKLSQNELLALTTEIVASHVSNNTVAVSDLPEVIQKVYGSLKYPFSESRASAGREATACGSDQEIRHAGNILFVWRMGRS